MKAGLIALLTASYAAAATVPCAPAAMGEGETLPRAPVAHAASGHDHGGGDHGAHPVSDADHAGHAAGGGNHAGHPARAEASSDETTAPCHEPPPELIARCPCGCDEKSRARTPGGRLDPGVPVAVEPFVVAGHPDASARPPVACRAARPGPPDKVPIHIS